MKPRWIIVGCLLSVAIHLSILMALGKVELNLPSFDFIETYLFEKKPDIKPNIKRDTDVEKTEAKQLTNNLTTIKDNYHEDLTEIPEIIEEISKILSKDASNWQPVMQLQTINPFARFIKETMKFNIYWMGIYVGSATLSVSGNETEVTITSTVRSTDFISNFYYVNDRAESRIEYGKPKHFTLIQAEGKYRGNKETIFDYDKGEIIFTNHLKNSTTYHKGIDKLFMDVLSGFFYLRTLPIKLNESIAIDIFDSNKFATVQVLPIREEKIDLTDKKQIDTIVIKPDLNTEGLFKRKGDIIIWLSRDENKIPLRIETKVPIGKVVAELKEYRKD